MKKSIALSATILTTSIHADMKQVTFQSHGFTLAGNLYIPDNYQEGQKLPAVIVTGAWTSVKEQMPANYAKTMAERGFAALTFDFRGWGASEGEPKYLEDPARKTADIIAAASFLTALPETQETALGFGICASAGYMIDAANASDKLGKVTLVAPWLHNAAIVEQVYGGKDSVEELIALSKSAEKETKIIEAASTTNKDSLMFQAPYYTESNRGAIEAYDNQFNLASWEPWLTYDALQSAAKLITPVLIVSSEAAALPQGTKEFAELAGGMTETIWLDDISQFDFYDQPTAIKASADAAAEFFGKKK